VQKFRNAGVTILPFIYDSKSKSRRRKRQKNKEEVRQRKTLRYYLHKIPWYLSLKRFLFFDLRQIWVIIGIIKRCRIDIVHLNDGISPNRDGIISANLMRIPCVVHERRIRNYDRFEIYLSKYIGCLVAISNAVLENCRQQSVKSHIVKRIYNPVSSVTTDPEKIKAIRNRYSSEILISLVGNIIEWKGQLTLLRAVKKLKQEHHIKKFKALIIGGVVNYRYYKTLKKFVRDNDLEDCVAFIGYVNDVHNYMQASELLIHASDKPEPFGRVIVEALSIGKVIIASNIGGPKEIIENGRNGLLFEHNLDEDLLEKLLLVISGKFEIDSQKVSKEVLEKFSVERHVENITSCYDAIYSVVGKPS